MPENSTQSPSKSDIGPSLEALTSKRIVILRPLDGVASDKSPEPAKLSIDHTKQLARLILFCFKQWTER